MAFISITRLRIRSWRFLPQFLIYAFRTDQQARRASGCLAVDALPDANHTFWTRSVWVDQQAMRQYISSGAHASAMRKLAHWCDEASVAHWVQESTGLPDWQEVHRQMRQIGRQSKLKYPSQQHLNFEIPAPKLR